MQMTRRDLLASPMAASAAGALAAQDASGPLNIIHIGVDTWSAHYLGCYGSTEIRTPNVDALARKSVVFEQAYPEVLPTLPARWSIYTGRRIFPSDMYLSTRRSGEDPGLASALHRRRHPYKPDGGGIWDGA